MKRRTKPTAAAPTVTTLARMLPPIWERRREIEELQQAFAKDADAQPRLKDEDDRLSAAADHIERALMELKPTTVDEAIAVIAVAKGYATSDDLPTGAKADFALTYAVSLLVAKATSEAGLVSSAYLIDLD